MSTTLSEIRRSTVAVAAVSVVTFGVGTAIAPGPGSAAGAVLGTIFGGLAEIVYEIKMAPAFDDYYHFD